MSAFGSSFGQPKPLFGSTANTSAPTTSAFGAFAQPQQQQQQQQQPGSNLFGFGANPSQPAQQQQPSTGLFGSNFGQPQQQQQQQQQPTQGTTGLFGQQSTTTQPNTGLNIFGQSNAQQQQQQQNNNTGTGTSLFGTNNTFQNPQSQGTGTSGLGAFGGAYHSLLTSHTKGAFSLDFQHHNNSISPRHLHHLSSPNRHNRPNSSSSSNRSCSNQPRGSPFSTYTLHLFRPLALLNKSLFSASRSLIEMSLGVIELDQLKAFLDMPTLALSAYPIIYLQITITGFNSCSRIPIRFLPLNRPNAFRKMMQQF